MRRLADFCNERARSCENGKRTTMQKMMRMTHRNRSHDAVKHACRTQVVVNEQAASKPKLSPSTLIWCSKRAPDVDAADDTDADDTDCGEERGGKVVDVLEPGVSDTLES